MSAVTLNADQTAALREIMAACQPATHHLLTGYAGTGKTTLMQHVVAAMLDRRMRVAVCAPTHKAAAVLRRKLAEAGLDGVDVQTVHSLLSLRPKKGAIGEAPVFEREPKAAPVKADAVVIDEASMLDSQLMRHIRRHLAAAFVLFVGDPAQLPPVGEVSSEAFQIKSRSHLSSIIRQAAGNPILQAAQQIRDAQGREPDWGWIAERRAGSTGVFVPNGSAEAWMRRAFTSEAFAADQDQFRYLAWTNAKVAQVNRKVRRWIYGRETPTPFMPGERVLFRAPVIRDDDILFANNEEAKVLSIETDLFEFRVPRAGVFSGWVARVPSWRIELERIGGETGEVHIPSDPAARKAVHDRIVDEAQEARERWDHRRAFASAMGDVQHVYALTVHKSQGSTFGWVFIDIADIRKRGKDNALEMQQLCYVAVTRPTQGAVLVNA